MKMNLLIPYGCAVAAALFTGCASRPHDPNMERGPHGTYIYDMLVEASPAGAHIEVNGTVVGDAPLHLKIYGDRNGTFHDFGSCYYTIRAFPLATNQFTQLRVFGTGRRGTRDDHIAERIYFDMNQNLPAALPPEPQTYYGPQYYFYGPGFFEPEFRFYFGPPVFWFHHHRH